MSRRAVIKTGLTPAEINHVHTLLNNDKNGTHLAPLFEEKSPDENLIVTVERVVSDYNPED